MPMSCTVTGVAELQWSLYVGVEFTRCDPEIHISDVLLADLDDGARRVVDDVYTIGEPCPDRPDTHHARLIPGRAPATAQIGDTK